MPTLTILLWFALLVSIGRCLSPQRPHIILIVADDLGYNDVSFHGSDQIPTPNIDFLAYNGVILNNYYVSPLCTPTRSALMTGRHPIHTGMQHSVISGTDPYGLSLSETLMSQHLNGLGYKSHIVGKWHLGFFSWPYTPLYRGFQSHFGYYQGRADYYNHTYERNLDTWGLDFRENKAVARNYTGDYSTTLFRDAAVRIISTHNKSEPLFLYLPFQAVHSGNKDGQSLQAPQEIIDKFKYIKNIKRRTYAAMTSALDDAVGMVYDTLKASDLLSNSIIIFTTDNGGAANGFDNNAASNFPLRGVKQSLWEGGMRGVGLVHSPFLKTQGYVSEQMFHVCDWLPTLYRAAGGDPSTLKDLDGVDAWQMLSENGQAVRSEILHNIDPDRANAAIRVGDFKLIVGKASHKYNGWYPPYQLEDDHFHLHISNFSDDFNFNETEVKQNLRIKFKSTFRDSWDADVIDRMKELQQSFLIQSQETSLIPATNATGHFMSKRSKGISRNRKILRGSPVVVNCGPKPANASENCHSTKSYCLFNIREDPCEYNNIADIYPDIVKHLLDRLESYNETAVPPRNQSPDPAGNPAKHGGVWEPWIE